jgi:hypothetical protein
MVAVDARGLRAQVERALALILAPDGRVDRQPLVVRLVPAAIVTAAVAVAYDAKRRRKSRESADCAAGGVPWRPPVAGVAFFFHPDEP